VLVLDEPTAGMDVAGETAMVEFLRTLNHQRGVTILLVTHLLPIVVNLARSMVLMAGGNVLQGPIDEVLQEDRLTQLYGVRVRVGSVDGQRTVVVAASRGLDV
jgi:ABC-type cobalamin/Fe3+-siderophores transport system ATPase subunit